jgi:histidyl-tRNA synthetase
LKLDSADVLVTNLDEKTSGESLRLASELRREGWRVVVYPEASKLDKQLKYASQLNVEFVCILGETEIAENKVTVKNLRTREQETVSRSEVFGKIKR